jgi:hypothetical protein
MTTLALNKDAAKDVPKAAGRLAIFGIAMAPLPFPVVAGELAAALAFALFQDGVKIPVFARLQIS